MAGTDWRHDTMDRIRALIEEADPDVSEEAKWAKASNPAGVPTWSHDGIICTGEIYKDKVKLTFMHGASLDDPDAPVQRQPRCGHEAGDRHRRGFEARRGGVQGPDPLGRRAQRRPRRRQATQVARSTRSHGTTTEASRAPQARTRLARRAVLDAARSLFLERGYGATTIDAISSASEVPQATVYRLFSSKTGHPQGAPRHLGRRRRRAGTGRGTQSRAVAPGRDAPGGLLGTARSHQRRHQHAGLRRSTASWSSAAGSDPDAAAVLDELTRQRQEGQGRVATALARAKALRPGMRARDAGDIIHALASPELYQLLVVDRAVVAGAVRAMARRSARRPTAAVDHRTRTRTRHRPRTRTRTRATSIDQRRWLVRDRAVI